MTREEKNAASGPKYTRERVTAGEEEQEKHVEKKMSINNQPSSGEKSYIEKKVNITKFALHQID